MLSWGIISACMASIKTPTEFYVMRFALGAAEAGFFPGIILYLSHWFPDSRRAGIVSTFMTATAIAGVIGSPLSGYLLQLHGLGGLDGWQWLFLIEGIPSVLAGFAVFFLLPNSPAQAPWLTAPERESLSSLLAKEQEAKGNVHASSLRAGILSPPVWRLGLVYLSIILSFNTVSLWLPQFIKSFVQLDNTHTAFLTTLPFLSAAVAMVVNGHHSDKTGERRRHIIIPACLGALGLLIIVTMKTSPWLQVIGLCITTAGVWSTLGPFWTLPASILRGRAAAGGIALVNSLGNLGGFLGPYFMALCKTHLGNFDLALACLALILLGGCLLVPNPTQEKPRVMRGSR